MVIDDPDFCREHLVRFKKNRDNAHLLMVQDGRAGRRACFVRSSDSMKFSRRLGCLQLWKRNTGELSTVIPGFSGMLRICFSVDGIVMLTSAHLSGNPKLILWNPSIKKHRFVPYSQDTEFLELGMGFDPLIKDYKLVRVTRRNTGSVDIYTIGTASWRTVGAAQGTVKSIWFKLSSKCHSIYFKGCLCICSKTELISFDLSREAFKSVHLPEYNKNARQQLTLVDGGSSLAVLHLSLGGVSSIWVLDGNDAASSWTVRCTFKCLPDALYLKMNGDLLFSMYPEYRLFSYNVHTEEERQINQLKTYHIFGYKESLVLLK